MAPDNPTAIDILLSGFDDEVEAEVEPEAVEPELEQPEDEVEQEDEQEDEQPEEEQAEEGEEEEGEAEPEAEEVAAEYSPDVLAYLQKYGGDEGKALQAAAELYRLMGRRDEEKEAALQENAQLRAALIEVQTLNGGGPPLNEVQREWVEGAAMSANPAAFIQQAVNEQAFDLARAVCREWAHTNPYDAQRIGQFVDAQEAALYQAQQQQQNVAVSMDDVLKAMDEHYPEMRAYYGQMAHVAQRLGDEHPLVLEARSHNGQEAVRGMLGLWEIARASNVAVSETREEVKRREREGGERQRARGVVSSTTNSPSPKETPRPIQIMPGLTLEQLDTEFARS